MECKDTHTSHDALVFGERERNARRPDASWSVMARGIVRMVIIWLAKSLDSGHSTAKPAHSMTTFDRLRQHCRADQPAGVCGSCCAHHELSQQNHSATTLRSDVAISDVGFLQAIVQTSRWLRLQVEWSTVLSPPACKCTDEPQPQPHPWRFGITFFSFIFQLLHQLVGRLYVLLIFHLLMVYYTSNAQTEC